MGGLAPLAIRMFVGTVLVFMSQNNVFSATRMDDVEQVAQHGVPSPALAPHASVYAQFVCGMLRVAGALTRWAALVMIVSFVVALVGAHRALPFRTFLEPSAMFAFSIALFVGGPRRVSIDAWLRARRHARQHEAHRTSHL